MRRPGRLWFSTKTCGIEWQHRLCDPDTVIRMNDGSPCYAVSVEADHCVYYSENEPDDSLRLLFLHEIHHIPSMSPGEHHSIERIYGSTDATVVADREEGAAVYYARAYAEAAGPFLRLPKPPRKKKRVV